MKKEMLIGGEWVGAHEYRPAVSPVNGKILAEVAAANKAEVDAAIRSAYEAFSTFRHSPAHQRASLLEKTARLISEREEEFARIIVQEVGKPWKYALGEVRRGVETFKFAAEEAKQLHGETIPLDASPSGSGKMGYYFREPIGVVGAITPFNFPLNLVAHKVAPALAVGNTVVLKPAGNAALTSILLGEVMIEAGLPAGVLNIVPGSGALIGDLLVEDPRLRMISFTGSVPVGKRITQHAGLKKLIMELGSNSATLIDKSADLDLAAKKCVVGAFAFSGQVCISIQRIYVHRDIMDAFVEKFIPLVTAQKIGDPMDPATDIGPMITESEALRAREWVNEAVADGARVAAGGKCTGNVFEPTVLVDVNRSMKVVCNEIFAPVVTIEPFDTFEQGLTKVNDSDYGLQAGVFTNDLKNALQAARTLDVGGVHINEIPTFRVDHMPYGGNKDSGLGREGLKFTIEEMTNIKMVSFQL